MAPTREVNAQLGRPLARLITWMSDLEAEGIMGFRFALG